MLNLMSLGSAEGSDLMRCSISDSTPPRLVAGWDLQHVNNDCRNKNITLTTKYWTSWGKTEACSGFASLQLNQSVIVGDWSRFLTRIAKVAFQPPCICVFGSNPRSSGPCNAECHTLDTVPPGLPSYVLPTGVCETASNHWASSVADADWRGTRRCKVLKERRSNQDSSEPIMLPKKVRSRWSCNHHVRVKRFRNDKVLTWSQASRVLTTKMPASKSECPPKYFVPIFLRLEPDRYDKESRSNPNVEHYNR